MRSVILVILLFIISCTPPMIRKDDLQSLNETYRDKVVTIKKDIPPEFYYTSADQKEVLLKRGKKVRIWFEAADDWIRVKAMDSAEPREQAQGKTIIYLFRDDMAEEAEAVDLLKEKLATFLE